MTSAFTVLTGTLVTLIGVGGIENGNDLLSAAIVTVVGLMVAAVGAQMALRK